MKLLAYPKYTLLIMVYDHVQISAAVIFFLAKLMILCITGIVNHRKN